MLLFNREDEINMIRRGEVRVENLGDVLCGFDWRISLLFVKAIIVRLPSRLDLFWLHGPLSCHFGTHLSKLLHQWISPYLDHAFIHLAFVLNILPICLDFCHLVVHIILPNHWVNQKPINLDIRFCHLERTAYPHHASYHLSIRLNSSYDL